MFGLGASIADRRRLLRLSQEELAERLNRISGAATFTRTEISRYERGRRTPVGRTLTWLANALETTIEELRAGTAMPEPMPRLSDLLTGEPLDTTQLTLLAYRWQSAPPPQLTECASGRHVGERLAGEIEARTHDLRLLDRHLGGRQLADLVGREVAVTTALIRDASYQPATGQRLLAALSELAQVGGWVAADAGRTDEATRCQALSVTAAHAADRPDLAASALSTLAYQLANNGEPQTAVLLAGAADRGSSTSGPVARALFAERRAWAYARAGQVNEALRALDEADERYDPAAPRPGFAYWLDRDEIDVLRARAYVELGRHRPAVDLLRTALASYPAEHARELSLYRSYLAQALLGAGEHEEAGQIAATLVDAGSERAASRAALVRTLLPTP
jgi:transcriptional regulator with XRE-family HTH domain